MNRTVKHSEILAIFEVSKSTLRRWISKGLPHSKTPAGMRFDPSEVGYFLKKHPALRTPGRPRSPLSAQLLAAQLRKVEALASLYELKNAVQSGELVNVGEIERFYSTILIGVRDGAFVMPGAIAGQLEGLAAADIQTILGQRIGAIFEEAETASSAARVREHLKALASEG